MTDIFGTGLAWPYQTTPAGRLAIRAGSNRLLDSVEQIVATPKGCCPMDPNYGLDLDVYDPVHSVSRLAWDLADAIEYGEPRAAKIDVQVTGTRPDQGLVQTEVTLTPIGSQVPLNRVYPLYVRAQ